MASTVGHLVLMTVGFCFLNIVHSKFIDVGVKYHVTLDVFSGREDPEWDVDENSQLYNRLTWAVNNGPPTEMDDDLGYRGFIVTATNAFGQMAWKTVGRHTNEDLENTLLTSCSLGLDKEVLSEVKSGITGKYEEAPVAPNYVVYQPVQLLYQAKQNNGHQHIYYNRSKRQAQNVCSVRYEPAKWNAEGVMKKNNCYNYATNRMTNSFAQPGRGSGRKFTNLDVNDVYDACERDGLTKLMNPDAGRDCLIALVIWPGEDFHFYRLDNNGYWSHKSGQTEARDTDDSMQKITDPRRADRGPYVEFAGWLGVGPNVNLN